jgi:hypothetical protein
MVEEFKEGNRGEIDGSDVRFERLGKAFRCPSIPKDILEGLNRRRSACRVVQRGW